MGGDEAGAAHVAAFGVDPDAIGGNAGEAPGLGGGQALGRTGVRRLPHLAGDEISLYFPIGDDDEFFIGSHCALLVICSQNVLVLRECQAERK